MFSTPQRLARRTGPGGLGRAEYLQTLVSEFQSSDDGNDQLQILANLANFAYDPINFDALRRLNVVELFIDTLSDEQPERIEYGMGGLCNLVADGENARLVLDNDGLQEIVAVLMEAEGVRTRESALATLFYLLRHNGAVVKDIAESTWQRVEQLSQQDEQPQVRNLARIVLRERRIALQGGGAATQ